MTTRSRRFAFVTTFYPPYNFGGDGIAVRRLATLLASQGHHVEVIHDVNSFQALRPAGMAADGEYQDHPAIIHHGLRSRLGALAPLITQQTARPGLKGGRLKRLLRGGRFDVVHFHNASLIGATALGYPDALTLYTMHEHWLVCPTHVLWRFNREPCPARKCIRCQLTYRRPPQLWRYTGVLPRALRHVDAFIAPSMFTRDKHVEFGLRVRAPIVHIPNFIPTPGPVLDDAPPHDRPYFLFIGRLERIKGAHALVEAFTRYDNADLLLAGAGHDADLVRAIAGERRHIRFLGQMPYAALEGLMRHAIAVVVPSVGFEVFPTTVLEANAQGTPVIGHRIGPIPEMLDGRGGITYAGEQELLDALEMLRADPAKRDALGRRGREEYEAHWTPERHLERYFALIENLESGIRQFA
jgi:glycosyltransferase involved in cell wall biosynthesis